MAKKETKDTKTGDEIEDRLNEAAEKGYRGVVPDQAPDVDHTVEGAAAGRSPGAPEARVAAAKAVLADAGETE